MIISAENIVLRPLKMEDLEILSKWNFDPDVMKYFPTRPTFDLAKQRQWLQKQIEAPDKEKYIINLDDKKIGLVSAFNIDVEARNFEFGITIGEKEYWGSGHTENIVKVFLSHYFIDFAFHLAYLRVFESNERGIAFFEKIGFRAEGVLLDRVYFKNDNRYESYLSMSITNEQFCSLHD